MKIKNIIMIIIFLLLLYGFTPSTFAKFHASKEIDGSIIVPENNYCLNNGFETLSDCMLVMENYSDSVNNAKMYINSKGSPDFSKTAPIVKYKELIKENVTDIITLDTSYKFGTYYNFNVDTGNYTINNVKSWVSGDNHFGNFTCLSDKTTCSTIYRVIEEDEVSLLKYNIHTYDVWKTFESDYGLYAMDDDLGKSYYYRGNVKNNLVLFNDMYWKIIRQNGDGSVRLIYYGKEGSLGVDPITSSFNESAWNPTYVGYMINESVSDVPNTSQEAIFSGIDKDAEYCFSKGSLGFSFATGEFDLNHQCLLANWERDHEKLLNDGYSYTLFSTDINAKSRVAMNLEAYESPTSAKVTYQTMHPKSYDEIVANTSNSTIKSSIDLWYQNNILSKNDESGNLIENYLADNIFCNDRSLQTGNGYSLENTIYKSFNRLSFLNQPTLTCSNLSDKFSVSDTIGNSKLTYAIGTITADEVLLSGGLSNNVNPLYYLNYNNDSSFVTMTASYFHPSDITARVWSVLGSGAIDSTTGVSKNYGVRPVVNIKKSVKILSGDGTIDNPFTLGL